MKVLMYYIRRKYVTRYPKTITMRTAIRATYGKLLTFILYLCCRKTGGKEVPDGCPIITVCADVRGVCRQHRGPRDLSPVALQPAGHHATLSQKQFQHHVHVRTRSVSAEDIEESGFVDRYECQHSQETSMLCSILCWITGAA